MAKDFFTLEVSPKKPYIHAEPEATLIYEQGERWSRESPALLQVHPSAKHFPGLLKKGYKVVTRDVPLRHVQINSLFAAINKNLLISVNYNRPDNQTHYSTGLYAPAGKAITVQVPEQLIGKAEIQLGIHTDRIPTKTSWHREWRRMPFITTAKLIDKQSVTISNPFGGLIYINLRPEAADVSCRVRIEGGSPAPHYVQGETTMEQWRAMLSETAAPWGEFETENLIITMSTEGLRKIKDPERIAQVWSSIIGACYDLAQIPDPFFRKQRIVLDEQVWLGLMHSGYPVMAHHREGVQHYEAEQFIHEPETLENAWGFFHEIGHNMQNVTDWVFHGTMEVSVNLFSLYIYDQVIMGRELAHTGVSGKATRAAMERYFSNGARYEDWVKDPFLGLILFRQIRNEFGWDVFKKLFARFNAANIAGVPMELPCESTGDQRKIDYWVYHLSDLTQRDMAPFFLAWGIPVTPELVDYTAKRWRHWMPYHFKPELYARAK